MIETIRINQKAKEQLISLKRKTGIGQWNILCRQAFCMSLAEKSLPTAIGLDTKAELEIRWNVFSGQYPEIYLALLKERCHQDGLSIDKETLNEQLFLHLHRGIGMMMNANR
jgi:DNA sulfur modification protein DndE